MDNRQHERRRQGVHGLVTSLAVRGLLVAAVLLSLSCGIAGGLLRAGVVLPVPAASGWIGPAVAAHAFLMICTFMGTVIGIERAVAVKHRLAFTAPLASGLAGLVMLAGSPVAAAWLAVAAGAAFIAVNVIVVRRQRAPHTVLLLVGAFAWCIGNLLFAIDVPPAAALPWWFAFLVLTIAAERLEMTRLMRRRAGAAPALHALLVALLLGAALSVVSPAWGGLLYGAALVGLAAWLLAFDIARRTVKAQALSRYMAVCMLLGYGWLAAAGVAWAATSLGWPWRDLALHGLGLGFVFSMMLGHAPVILPALARVKLLFGPLFYLPLGLLHASLLLRLAGGPIDLRLLAAGAAGNALSIALFAATVAGSALAWRLKHPPASSSRSSSRHDTAAGH
jgi:hypothetical protein